MRIWKYPIIITDRQTLQMPAGAQLLTVQMQGDGPQLWAIVDESESVEEQRTVAIYGTGHPLPHDPGKYIATFQYAGGAFVGHVFEV
jgi:hypothetical protein